jgi:uncharacterized membrane protein YqjE
MSASPSPSSLPFSRLRRILNSLIAALENRVQLFGLEFREEKLRVAEAVLLGAIAFFFAQLGLLLLTLALAFLFRENAVWVLALCGVLYGAIALACGALLRSRLRNRPPPFSGTVTELKKDREWLNSIN